MHGEQQRRAVQEGDREHVERVVEQVAVADREVVVQSRCGKIPNGTASPQLPISSGRMKPSTRYSQIAEANAQATWVPMPSARARRYMRAHHSRIDVVRKKPAISHQPPSFSGGKMQAVFGAGGSSASQGSWRTNCDRIPVHRGQHVEADDLDGDEAAEQRCQPQRSRDRSGRSGRRRSCPASS